jgi:carboxymethylenebutenolidase
VSKGEWTKITAADGHELDAWRVEPSGTARGAIVVVQEIFGVNGHIRAIAEEYARDGYATIAPALFDRVRKHVELGYTPDGVTEGRALRNQIGWEKPIFDLQAAASAVQPRGRVATIGYCWGGSLSYLMACRADVACAIAYYGGQIAHFLDERPKAPVLMHFGENDPIIPATDRERIIAALPGAEIFVYPAGHGFNCTERQDYEPESAKIAKERTLAFLQKHVG